VSDYTAQIAALEAGLASGEARVESDGDVVMYRGVGDIMRALDYFRRLQNSALAAGGITRPATTVAVFDPS
jgi:hypothetical protein